MKAEDVIESISKINGLSGLDEEKRRFFYDETNNYRRVCLRGGRFNFEGAGDFLLGGISLKNDEDLDFDGLKKNIKIDKSAKEIKLKHIARGNLLSVLKSKKLNKCLAFLNENKVVVHFQRINIFYWSVVDIVDSVIVYNKEERFIRNVYQIKDCLYRCLLKEKTKVLTVMDKYSYPDVGEKDLNDFYKSLGGLIALSAKKYGYIGSLLIEVLRIGESIEEAVFIQGESKRVLVQDFSLFYRQKVMVFPNSKHFFDREDYVERKMADCPMEYNGKSLNNFEFIDSCESKNIQISDVLIGYLSKVYNFCKDTPPLDI